MEPLVRLVQLVQLAMVLVEHVLRVHVMAPVVPEEVALVVEEAVGQEEQYLFKPRPQLRGLLLRLVEPQVQQEMAAMVETEKVQLQVVTEVMEAAEAVEQLEALGVLAEPN